MQNGSAHSYKHCILLCVLLDGDVSSSGTLSSPQDNLNKSGQVTFHATT